MSTDQARGARPGPDPSDEPGRAWLVITILALCGTIVSLQQTMLLPLLPELPDLVGTSAAGASWMVTATLLAGAVATPVASRMADMYGKRRVMLLMLAVVATGSLVGGLSDGLPLLIVARLLQGSGMAIVPIGIAMMRDELPSDKVPLAVAIMSATLAIGAGVGLPLGGLLAEHLDWHAIFWLPGMLAVLLAAAVRAVVRESPMRTAGTFDLLGAVLLSAALTLLLVAVSQASSWGWGDLRTVAAVATGIAILIVWVPLERRVRNPLVDLRTAMDRPVLIANVVSLLMGFGMFVNMLVTTQQLQAPPETGYGLGQGLMESGLWMAPGAIAFGFMAPVSAAITRRWGTPTALIVGGLIMGGTYAARVFLSDNLALVVLGSVIVSVGTAVAYSALPTLIMQVVPATESAAANGLNTLLRSVGTSVGSALVTAVFAASTLRLGEHEAPSPQALAAAFWLAAGASLLAVAASLPLTRIPRLSPARAVPMQTLDLVTHGQVQDRDGRPVGNAVVTVIGAMGEHVDWGRTDSTGAYSVGLAGPASYLFVVSAPGWNPTSVRAEVGVEQSPPLVTLQQPVVVSGQVLTSGGEPGDGIAVVLTRSDGGTAAITRTDPDGRYSIPLVGVGQYVLTAVDRATNDISTASVASDGRTQRIDLRLEPASAGLAAETADQPGSRPSPSD